MLTGFENAKDWLDVLVVPIVICILGFWIPRRIENRKRDKFLDLIRRELDEMAPQPAARQEVGHWPAHLNKQFIHEAIFRQPSENRDFILSLDPDLAYNEAQLWIHYDKAVASKDPAALAEHGARWCHYLCMICRMFDKRRAASGASLECTVYTPWKQLVSSYHPHQQV